MRAVFLGNTHDSSLYDEFENYIFKIINVSPLCQWFFQGCRKWHDMYGMNGMNVYAYGKEFTLET